MPSTLPGGMQPHSKRACRRSRLAIAWMIAAAVVSSLSNCGRPLQWHEWKIVPPRQYLTPPQPQQGRSRFGDTVTIALAAPPQPSRAGRSSPAPQEIPPLDSARVWCEAGRTRDAERALLAAIELRSESDSLHWEALFQLGECYALHDAIDRGIGILAEVAYRTSGVPADVHQRALVRLGHLWCLRGDAAQAQDCFQRLQRLYPSSPYHALARCSAIR